jgi:hypothetical protein
MPSHWRYNATDFAGFVTAQEIGKTVEWSWKYNMSIQQLYIERQQWNWHESKENVLLAANLLYPNKAPNFGLKLFFFQVFGYYWDARTGQLVKGELPIRQRVNHMGETIRPQQDLEANILSRGDNVINEQLYHKPRLERQAIYVLLHKVSPETQRYLKARQEGRLRRPSQVITEDAVCYRTRGSLQRIHRAAANETTVYAPPRVIQEGEGSSGRTREERALDEANPVISLESDEE